MRTAEWSGPGAATAALAAAVLLLAPLRAAPARPFDLGDLNCDGQIDAFDIDPFVLALTDPAQYAAQFPGCDYLLADISGDGQADAFDIDPFVALLAGSGPITDTPLAGRVLEAYPYFEYVRAFTADQPLALALDPTRFPEISGKTADLYVVPHKSAAEWAADPILVDATPDGALPASFTGPTIQANTFVLAGPDELDSDAGLDLGVGYDLVCDFNRNQRLDGGDFIDGRGAEAGCYVVHDTTAPGPLAVTAIDYSGGAWLGQRTWYPVDIADLDPLPLVVVGHGHGHEYTWYDYLQSHLASYGYVAMSHQNDTGGGFYGAAMTTLKNTDYFLGHLATIAGGVLDGRVDGHRLIWIGHSRGGEGIAQAYDLIHDGAYTPQYFGLDDIVLLSAIAPPDVTGPNSNHPHGVNYHLLYGTADGDVWGCAASQHQPFRQFERAVGFKGATFVHGADHNDFNCCGWDDFWGPPETEIGREEAQRVAKGLYLALVKHYAEGNIPAKDFLCRRYETCKPIGVAASTIVLSEYRDGPVAGNFVIDDYQTQESPLLSSSGGAVTFDVLHLTEGKLQDGNSTFTWTAADPMNGMTRAGPADTARGVVFDWTTDAARSYEFEIVPEHRDFTPYACLSLTACQGTRHPETIAELADLTFTVVLRDSAGTTSSIHIAAYGGGIEETYQRVGCGDETPGWMNEFQTVRIRLTDFLHNGSGLNLADVAAVRFEFGGPAGSARGRLGLDHVELTRD